MLFLILSPFFCLSDHRYFEHFSTLQNVWNEKGVGAVCMLVGVCVQRGKVLNRKRSAWQPPGEAGPVTAAPRRSSGRLPEVGHGTKGGSRWKLDLSDCWDPWAQHGQKVRTRCPVPGGELAARFAEGAPASPGRKSCGRLCASVWAPLRQRDRWPRAEGSV